MPARITSYNVCYTKLLRRRVAGNLSHALTDYSHPFLEQRENQKAVGVIVVTSDKGLCGGLNTNVLRLVLGKMKEWRNNFV